LILSSLHQVQSSNRQASSILQIFAVEQILQKEQTRLTSNVLFLSFNTHRIKNVAGHLYLAADYKHGITASPILK